MGFTGQMTEPTVSEHWRKTAIAGLVGWLWRSLYIIPITQWLMDGRSRNDWNSVICVDCYIQFLLNFRVLSIHFAHKILSHILFAATFRWHFRAMPHSHSYSEMQPLQQPIRASYQRRASSDISANVNGFHRNRRVFCLLVWCQSESLGLCL